MKKPNAFFGLIGSKKSKDARARRIVASQWRNVEPGDFIKATFTHKGETERMWVEVIKVTKSGVVGLLNNEPVINTQIHLGERVTVPWKRITERSSNPAKFDRCVKDVQKSARKYGRPVNAYAVCTAAGTRNNPDDSPVYIDAAYGSLFQKRGKRGVWYIRPSFRHPGFKPGKGPDGDKFGDWQKLGESLGPERALKSGRLTPYSGTQQNPSKPPSEMTAGEINKALDKLDAEQSKLTDEAIAAGFGHLRMSEIEKLDHPIAAKYRAHWEKRRPLAVERDLRYGPGAPSRLPKGFGPRKWKGNPIQDPNSSGQGYDPDHAQVPYKDILESYGYHYSHSTPVVVGGSRQIHHTWKKGGHNVGARLSDYGWKWEAGKSGSGRGYNGTHAADLEKYLKGRKKKGNPIPGQTAKEALIWEKQRREEEKREEEHEKKLGKKYKGNPEPRFFKTRQAALSYATKLKKKGIIARAEHYGMGGDREWVVWEGGFMVSPGYYETIATMHKGNPESSAAQMYESFHGEPSKELVTFEEEEHYHSNLGSVGVLVELRLVTVTGYDVKLIFSKPESLVMETQNPQKWVLPFKRGKKNYEDIGYAPYYLQHDIGFRGTKIYRPVKRDGQYFTLLGNYGMTRKEAVDWIKSNATPTANNPGIMDWFKGKTHKTTVYHVPRQSPKMTKSTSYKGFDIYKDLQGAMRVPQLERESVFDSVGKAKSFIDHWTRTNGKRKCNPSLNPTLLTSNESGTQLYLTGGDQSVELTGIHMGEDDGVPVKDSMVLGEAYFVSYFTQKSFDDFEPIIYEHDIAEEDDPPSPKYRKDEEHTAKNRRLVGKGTGLYPTVRYDTLNQKLYLDGGVYKIDLPLMGTSPGIEN